MSRTKANVAMWVAVFGLLAVGPASTAHAGLRDRLKQKIEDKATKKVENVADKKEDEKADEESSAPASEAKGDKGGKDEKVSEVSTKFDYVPGDKVVLFDDFTQDELGEFPAQWKLVGGTFEVAEQKGERWVRCMSDNGDIRMKVPATLPEFWTLEFDFFCSDPGGAIALTVDGVTKDGSIAWETRYPYSGSSLNFVCGPITANTAPAAPINGRHHVMFMARQTAMKVYMDTERLANVPDVTGPGTATEINIHLGAPSHPMITNVRFAEGCKPPKDMLATGKLVTYGIHFDSGSDIVLPDSAPVLRQVASYMETNAAVKLKITGHTDNVGASAGNLDLSKRRAAAVAKVLADQFKIAADRFSTDGKGDSEKVADNGTPAGRAMNRRVEFAKS